MTRLAPMVGIVAMIAASVAAAEPVTSLNPMATPLHDCLNVELEGLRPAGFCEAQSLTGCHQLDVKAHDARIQCFLTVGLRWTLEVEHQINVMATRDENLAALAHVNLEFGLRENMVDCDRRVALARLAGQPTQQIQTDRSECTARSAAHLAESILRDFMAFLD